MEKSQWICVACVRTQKIRQINSNLFLVWVVDPGFTAFGGLA